MDHILNNLKNYKDVAEKRSIYYHEIDKALDLVKDYIKEKKLIIYGGLAIDIALKLVGQPGIYQDDVIPDFDVYSADFYNDSNKLAVVLYEAKLNNVSSINAVHFNSRRVRVNYQSVCDFSYIPKKIFDKLPYIKVNSKSANLTKYNGLRIIHPDFQRLDLHRSYSIPYANPPQEVITHRLEKDAKRFRLINETYPLPAPHIKIKDYQYVKFTNTDNIYSGFLAYAVLYSTLLAKIKESEIMDVLKNTGLDAVINDNLKKIIAIYWHGDSIQIPSNLIDISYITELVNDAEFQPTYYKYLDNLRPPMTKKDNKEIFNIYGESVPYYQVDNIKIAAGNGILIYFLQKYFESDDDRYAALYNSTLLLIESAEKIVIALQEKDPQYLNNNYEKLPFFLPSIFYGDTLVESDIPRPPFGYYPAKSTDWPAFDLNNKNYILTGEIISS